jgi:hypothetical protein
MSDIDQTEEALVPQSWHDRARQGKLPAYDYAQNSEEIRALVQEQAEKLRVAFANSGSVSLNIRAEGLNEPVGRAILNLTARLAGVDIDSASYGYDDRNGVMTITRIRRLPTQ